MKKTIEDIEVKNKRVIVRCDFNVPMQDGAITDDSRIRAALPTIQYLKEHDARVILMSHMGRPKGEPKMEFTMKPVADRLSELLGAEVVFVSSPAVVDDAVRSAAEALQPGQVMLLENVRFRKEETENDPEFAKELASLAEIFVQEAFGTAHRAHASTAGIAEYLPAVSGYLIEKEVKFLGDAVESPKRPFVAILGGAKVKDKIPVIKNLIGKVDTLLIGGGMAYTFFKSEGYEIGKSILDEESIELAASLLKEAKEAGVEMLLPVDIVCADKFDNDANTKTVPCNEIPADMEGLDVGPETVKLYGDKIRSAATVVWNGPMGVFEMDTFAKGTNGIAEAMAECPGTTIIGGGDSAAAIRKAGLADKMTHISTGGGASL
jgi:triosephosphate isomerase